MKARELDLLIRELNADFTGDELFSLPPQPRRLYIDIAGYVTKDG